MNIAIVGATGNVGRKTLEVFDKKNFRFDNLYLVASEKSAGKKILFRDKEYEIENLENYDFSKADITFFAAGGKIAEKYAENAAKHTVVIDNSSFFRMDPDVPLIVPQVNSSEIKKMNIFIFFISEEFTCGTIRGCLLYTSPSPRDGLLSRMPSSA